MRDLVNTEEAQKFSNKFKNVKHGSSAFKQIYQMVDEEKSPFSQQIYYNHTTLSCSSDTWNILRDHYAAIFQGNLVERSVENLPSRVSS